MADNRQLYFKCGIFMGKDVWKLSVSTIPNTTKAFPLKHRMHKLKILMWHHDIKSVMTEEKNFSTSGSSFVSSLWPNTRKSWVLPHAYSLHTKTSVFRFKMKSLLKLWIAKAIKFLSSLSVYLKLSNISYFLNLSSFNFLFISLWSFSISFSVSYL